MTDTSVGATAVGPETVRETATVGPSIGFAGWIVLVAGVAIFIAGATHQTTIHDYGSSDDTYNLGLLQTQMIMVHTGLALLIASVIMISTGALITALRK